MDTASISAAITSQYQAALAMFRSALAAVPAGRWDHPDDLNSTWRVAYHALYFTHLYLTGSLDDFVMWSGTSLPLDRETEPIELPAGTPAPSVDEVLAYADAIEAMLPSLVGRTPYDGPSGFFWIHISRFEHHLYNIRHLMQHTGQLTERARANGGGGTAWSGRGSAAVLVTAPAEP